MFKDLQTVEPFTGDVMAEILTPVSINSISCAASSLVSRDASRVLRL